MLRFVMDPVRARVPALSSLVSVCDCNNSSPSRLVSVWIDPASIVGIWKVQNEKFRNLASGSAALWNL